MLFACVFSLRNGRFKLHDTYRIDPKASSVSESSLWIPIDHNIVTPFHEACNRVPGTFPPTLFVRGIVRAVYRETSI
jgi:hypothetical protein